MKKLINYLLYLIVTLSAVFIINNIINFSKKTILLNEHQGLAALRSETMLQPVVRLSQIFYSSTNVEGGMQSLESVTFATGFSAMYLGNTNETIILTNDHFCNSLDEDTTLIVENYLGQIVYGAPKNADALISSTRNDMDLCALKIKGYVKPAKIKGKDYTPTLFEEVFVVGSPSGDFPIIIDTYLSSLISRKKVTSGNMSSLSSSGNDFLMISEQIFPGHSGSPIYTKDGEVIGILFGALRSYGGLGAGHEDIHSFLEAL
tara:strand:- start:3453 stop:4235 length:783 start_codon:yes stop_codon:yes gene_type:complete